jgi:hypothetical protein
MTEVEAEDVGPGARQGKDHLRRAAGGAEGGDDTGAAVADHESSELRPSAGFFHLIWRVLSDRV